MSAQQGTSSVTGGPRGMRRKTLQTTELVKTSFLPGRGELVQRGSLPGNEERLPLVITPAVDNVDLAGWCTSHAEDVERYLDRYGAVMFRGFPIAGPREFEAVASAIAGELFAEYGDLPPEQTSERIYHSTPYPHDKMILFHNESSHLSSWPLRQFFFCVDPSEEGGETPLLDCREICEVLDKDIVEAFERNLVDRSMIDLRYVDETIAAGEQHALETLIRARRSSTVDVFSQDRPPGQPLTLGGANRDCPIAASRGTSTCGGSGR